MPASQENIGIVVTHCSRVRYDFVQAIVSGGSKEESGKLMSSRIWWKDICKQSQLPGMPSPDRETIRRVTCVRLFFVLYSPMPRAGVIIVTDDLRTRQTKARHAETKYTDVILDSLFAWPRKRMQRQRRKRLERGHHVMRGDT